AEVVRAELQLEAVGRLRLRARHDAGIVDHDVEGRVARQEALRERVNVLQRAELELLDLNVPAPSRRANPLRDRFALRHVPGGENNVGASLGEDARRLLSQTARPPVTSVTLPLRSIPSATSLAVVSAPNLAGSRMVILLSPHE